MVIKWLNKNIIGFSLASFFNDICQEMTTAILPSYINQITGSIYAPFFLGLIQGIADIASTFMKLVSGFVADKVSYYKPILILGYSFTGVVACIGTTTNIFMILFYQTFAWMSKGIREPLRDTWISKIVDPQFYGRAFGFHRICDTFGAFLGPLCAFILLKFNFSLSMIFMVAVIPGLLSVLPIIFLTHEKKEEHRNKKIITFFNQIKLLPKDFNYFLCMMFIFRLANFNQTLFIYRAQALLFSDSSYVIVATGWTLLCYTFFNFIKGISEFGMGFWSDFVSRKDLLAIFGFGFFGLATLCFMIPTNNIWLLFLFFAIAGLSAGTVKSLEKSYAAHLLPENVRGTGLGLLQTINGIGNLCSNVVVGMLWSFGSPLIGFAYAAILSFLSMIMLLQKNK